MTKKRLKISESNAEAINQRLNQIQGKATVKILKFQGVLSIAADAEMQLDNLGIAKKFRSGASYSYCPPGPWAKSYQYGQGATKISLIRGAKAWFLSAVVRTKVYPLQKGVEKLVLTENQDQIAVGNFRKGYAVSQPLISG
jgi:hypothetical protein